ncbi:MAG: glycosyltransferase [Pseudomonadales bacterium]
MRILHVYRTFFPDTQGGLEEVIRQICAGTTHLGADCTVFTTTKNTSEPSVIELDGIRVVRAPETFEVASCNVSLNALFSFREVFEQADVVHYHFPWPFADLLNLTTRQKKPSLVTYHSDIIRQKWLRRLYNPLMKNFLSSVDRIVCTSPNYFATSNLLTEYEQKVDVIPIGINRASYPVVSEDELAEAESQFGRGFFLFVGVLRYYKGLHILLDAIQNAPYKVVIVGSGPTERALKDQAAQLGLTNVVFTGYVSDSLKVALIQLSRAIIFPSYLRSEAFGVTLLEGAMNGKPLVSTEVGSGTSHVNVDGETGYVVAPGSARALRRAMDQLYKNPETANLMGTRARQRFDRLFASELMAERYWKLYHDLVGKSRSRE